MREVALRCGASERGIRILCDYLTILGFLSKVDGTYDLTLDTRVFLSRNSQAYLGGTLSFLAAEAVQSDSTILVRSCAGGRCQTARARSRIGIPYGLTSRGQWHRSRRFRCRQLPISSTSIAWRADAFWTLPPVTACSASRWPSETRPWRSWRRIGRTCSRLRSRMHEPQAWAIAIRHSLAARLTSRSAPATPSCCSRTSCTTSTRPRMLGC